MGQSEAESARRQTVADRVSGGKPVRWFLVDANRGLVAGVFLAVVYGLLLLLAEFGPGSAGKLLGQDPVGSLFTPVVIGIVIGVSLVLTFNQLVLSRELAPVGRQRERMADAMAFRQDIEGVVEHGTSPPEPSLFLRGLVNATAEKAQRLRDTANELTTETGDESSPQIDTADAVARYTDTIITDAEQVSAELEDEEFGTFNIVRAALNFNYSLKIYQGRRLRNNHEETLSETALETLDDLLETLEFFGPAREHFKTLYFRWEIIVVSRALIFLSLPALAVGGYMILVFEAEDLTGTIVGVDASLLVIGAAFVVGVSPFALFLAYILRIVSVAKWTLTIGPFILRETRREGFDWE